eukprot:TRINITY_DN4031_c0_g3_i1.p1 TRINITY_DN4031_c0_g3~~TRINITY_DN4031_c0_g3_i1.p1  ORF type:complete len:464 (+),score=121.19 TRINITY_DN4031_c0_g3_i1:55-1446(+)
MSGRPVDAEVTFTDADGDTIRMTAEVQGNRGRVSLYHNGTFAFFVSKVVFATTESKLYINGHEATIQMKPDSDDIILQISNTIEVGKSSFIKAETVDAAAELAAVRQKEAEEMDGDEEGLSPEMLAKAKAALEKKAEKEKNTKKKVPQESLTQLIEMGYTKNRAIRAFSKCNGTTVELALSWLEQHQTDADLDDELPDDQQPEWTVPLTAEQAQAKAKELQQQIQSKKEQRLREEKELQRQREKKRREEGQQKQEIQEEYEKKKRMQAYEERRREKEADLAAKAAVRKQINEDRIAKGWDPLPEPEVKTTKVLSKEDFFKQEEQRKKTAAAAADDDWDPMAQNRAAAPAPVARPEKITGYENLPIPGVTLTPEVLSEAISGIKSNPGCVRVLTAYISNIVKDPFNPKFRSIKTTNATFNKNILCVTGAVKVLLLAGFRPDGDSLHASSIHLQTFGEILKLLEG